jgi:hypothetical protein
MRIDAFQRYDRIKLVVTWPDIPQISRELVSFDTLNPALGGEVNTYRRMVEIALILCSKAGIDIRFDVRPHEAIRLTAAFLA